MHAFGRLPPRQQLIVHSQMLSLLLQLDLEVTVASLEFRSLQESLDDELDLAVLLLNVAVELLDLRHQIGAV